MKKNILFTTCLALFVMSCSNDSTNDLIDNTDPLPEQVTYNADVKTIIDNNCINCHSVPPQNGAPMPLTTYQQVKNAVENGNLIERISTTDLGEVMPFGGPRLPQNLIDTVIQWETDGLLEE